MGEMDTLRMQDLRSLNFFMLVCPLSWRNVFVSRAKKVMRSIHKCMLITTISISVSSGLGLKWINS